ncbi:hypothetical protein VNO77_33533 [Canavalia gladiata]|uniref:Uncharacterized protein n=1 Tax=Canavalia gladiata TaxID=3824 RepID=A0AAN9KDY4_CANGL
MSCRRGRQVDKEHLMGEVLFSFGSLFGGLHTFSALAHMMAQSQGMVFRLGAGVVMSKKGAATIVNQVPGSSALVPARRGHANRFCEIRGPWFCSDSTRLAQNLRHNRKYVLEVS